MKRTLRRLAADVTRPARRLLRKFRDVRAYSKSVLGVPDFASVIRFGLAHARARDGSSAQGVSPVVLKPRCLNGLQIELNSNEYTHFQIFDEVFLEKVYDLSRVPFTPDRVFDCGGHIGLFTALASARFGPTIPIETFEPNPDNAAYVRRLIDRNGLANVRLLQSAVSTAPGTQVFYCRNTVGGSLSGVVEGITGSFEVQVIDFPAHLRAYPISRLLMKIDIEGEELRLLPALVAGMPEKTALFFETHTGAEGWDSIENLLKDAEFNVTLLRNRDPFRDGFALRNSGSSHQPQANVQSV